MPSTLYDEGDAFFSTPLHRLLSHGSSSNVSSGQAPLGSYPHWTTPKHHVSVNCKYKKAYYLTRVDGHKARQPSWNRGQSLFCSLASWAAEQCFLGKKKKKSQLSLVHEWVCGTTEMNCIATKLLWLFPLCKGSGNLSSQHPSGILNWLIRSQYALYPPASLQVWAYSWKVMIMMVMTSILIMVVIVANPYCSILTHTKF